MKEFSLAKDWALKTISAGGITPQTYYLLGMSQFHCKEYNEAINSFANSLTKGFSEEKIRTMICKCKLNQNKLSEARQIAESLGDESDNKEIKDRLIKEIKDHSEKLEEQVRESCTEELVFSKYNHNQIYEGPESSKSKEMGYGRNIM